MPTSTLRKTSAAALALVSALACATGALCQTATQSMTAVINPAAKLSVQASAALAVSGSYFASYQASLPVSYRARTTSAGGGNITVRVSSDFTPSGGPTAASGALTYVCSGATLGTACSGTQTATSSQTPVLTLPASACTGGGGACSSGDPNSVTLQFVLTNNPAYSTGTYSVQLTFVISAT